MTTTINPIPAFNCASTFYVDPGTVKNAPEVSITKIDLYFKDKPEANNNSSGIYKPGVDVFLCELKTIGFEEVPDITRMIKNAHIRKTWDDITTSNDATTATSFNIAYPANVKTGKGYAIIVKYDGEAAYDLWKAVEGDLVVGTNNTTAGPSGKYVGKYFEYSHVNSNQGNNNSTSTNADGVIGNWKPLNTTDLKFKIYCAKYTPDVYANTSTVDPLTGDTITQVVAKRSYFLYKKPYEFAVFNALNSNNSNSLKGGELIYQNNVLRSETVSVATGLTQITSTNANFTTILGNPSNDRYIVVYSGINKNLRKVESIDSNNSITVDIPLTFTNAAATFSKVAVGKIDMSAKIAAFGKLEDAIAISHSNANSSLRFVNNMIESVTINDGGTGYANSDYIVFANNGVGAPEINATANVITDANGTILTYTLSNMGIGYTDIPDFIILNANAVSSAGANANLTPSVGATLRTEHSNAVLSNTEIINIPVNSMFAGAIDLENPYGTSYYMKMHYMYYSTDDGVADVGIILGGTGYANNDAVTFTGTGSGAAGRIVTDSAGKIVDINMVTSGSGYTDGTAVGITTSGGTGGSLSAVVGVIRNDVNSSKYTKLINLLDRHQLQVANTPIILSRSYEVTQANTTLNSVTGTSVNTNVSSVIEMVTTSNNDFVVTDIISSEIDVFYEKFSINNDYTDEHTGNGKALSKHISKIVNFGDNRTAEDIRVFIDAYRPIGTDVKVYVRGRNDKDLEAFVDKDWTLLEMKNGNNHFSLPANQLDVVEYEYGFPSYPNSSLTVTGSSTTELASPNVDGSNTLYNSELSVGDLVKVYSPLFPNNYHIDVVDSIVSNTQFTIKNNIANSSMVGTGMAVDLLGYKHQIFNNPQNDNVARYYADSMAEYDGYNTFAVKLVFLSNSEFTIPRVENIRAVGVTA